MYIVLYYAVTGHCVARSNRFLTGRLKPAKFRLVSSDSSLDSKLESVRLDTIFRPATLLKHETGMICDLVATFMARSDTAEDLRPRLRPVAAIPDPSSHQ